MKNSNILYHDKLWWTANNSIIDIVNNEFSQFLDNNSQICINQEEDAELGGAKLSEVNQIPTMNISQALKTEEVILNFQDDLEEIKK